MDHLYHTPGEWNLKRCSNSECGLLWLDPMPIEEEINKAYQDYFTHEDNFLNAGSGNLRSLLRSIFRVVHNVLLLLTLTYHERKRLNFMYLDKAKPGKLLEVGCGNGRRLKDIRDIGWEVEGLEVDPKAAALASRTYGLPVHLGALADIGFPKATFDAIIMHHVIEHVHDPVSLFAECRRILKSGGILVTITPNIESYGHRYFGSCWRGLEPPRHLHLFSQRTLRAVAVKAGFVNCDVRTTSARANWFGLASLDIKRIGKHELGNPFKINKYFWRFGYQFWSSFVHLKDRNSGEECVLKVIK